MKKNSLTDLSIIRDIDSLEGLSKFYKRITRHAIALSNNDEYRAEEAVQNAMITIGRYFRNNPGVKINGGLVSISIRNHIKDSYKRDNRLVSVGLSSELIIEDTAYEEYTENDCILNELARLSNEERKTLLNYVYNTAVELTSQHPDNLSYDTIRQHKKQFINKIKEKYGKK